MESPKQEEETQYARFFKRFLEAIGSTSRRLTPMLVSLEIQDNKKVPPVPRNV